MPSLNELASWFLEVLAVLTPLEREALGLSLLVAFWCTVVVLPLSALLGFVLSRRNFPGKTILDVVVHLPLVLPPVLTGYLLLLAFGRKGWIGAWLDQTFGVIFAFNWTGAVIASAVMALPLAVRAMRLAFDGISRDLEMSAAALGASKAQVLWRVTLPLASHGFAAAAILAFARSLGEFGATITFVSNIPGETRTIPNALYAMLQTPGTEVEVMRLALMSLAIAFLALMASEIMTARARRSGAMGSHASRQLGWRL